VTQLPGINPIHGRNGNSEISETIHSSRAVIVAAIAHSPRDISCRARDTETQSGIEFRTHKHRMLIHFSDPIEKCMSIRDDKVGG
jgi:hypothetical protein